MLNFYGSFFYINICGFIGRGKFLYETRVLDNSYLQFKFQLPTSDSTQISAGGPKVPIEGFVPLGDYFTISNGVLNFNILDLVVSEILEGSHI